LAWDYGEGLFISSKWETPGCKGGIFSIGTNLSRVKTRGGVTFFKPGVEKTFLRGKDFTRENF